MNTATLERMVVETVNGDFLTVAKGTEKVVPFAEMLAFWERVWVETEADRPDHSVVEDFLIDKRLEVERENRRFDT